jgi:two-component system OmpR family response regulator
MNAEKSIKVLLVEDSKLLAEQLSELLAAIPFTISVGVVTTEKDAIDASIAQRPDLLILDLHLKQGTGFGVLKALSRIDNPPRVVVLTNYALPQYREQALALGADYFLDKSSDFDRLPQLIHDLGQQSSAALAHDRH